MICTENHRHFSEKDEHLLVLFKTYLEHKYLFITYV